MLGRRFGVPLIALARYRVPAYPADQIPPEMAAIPAVTIAVRDAIRRAGGTPIEGPYTPERVWNALNDPA